AQVAVAGEGAHDRPGARGGGALAAPVAAVEDLAAGVVGVVDGQRPAAQPDRPGVEAADAVLLDPPEGDLHAGGGGAEGAAAGGAPVEGAVGVADPDDDRLAALERPAVGVLAVPGERRRLARRGREGLREEPPGDADLELDAEQAVRELGAAERDLERAGDPLA